MSNGAKGKKKSRPKRNEAQIPEWWLLENEGLYYTLDLEDEYSRRMMEERMAMYYAQLAEEEAAKGMMFDIDGNPITAEEAGTSSGGGGWKSNWTGRQKKDANGGNSMEQDKPKMFGGRNFKPGSDGWDPKQWGIDENDPDYEKYLKGEKLPQQFIDAMNNFAKATGHFKSHENYTSGLRSTEGLYGSLGEKQAHQPDWVKKKLRSTSQGESIRHGIYNDSPNKHLKYQPRSEKGGDYEENYHDSSSSGLHLPNPADQQENVALNSRPVVVHHVHHQPDHNYGPPSRPVVVEKENEPVPTPAPQWGHQDYYYNATTADPNNIRDVDPSPDAEYAGQEEESVVPIEQEDDEEEPEPEQYETQYEQEEQEPEEQEEPEQYEPEEHESEHHEEEPEYDEQSADYEVEVEEYVEEVEEEETVVVEEEEEEVVEEVDVEEYEEEVEVYEEEDNEEDEDDEDDDDVQVFRIDASQPNDTFEVDEEPHDDGEDGDLEDLQATLAAKMEELKRLQAM